MRFASGHFQKSEPMRRFALRGHERIRHLHELSINAPERGRTANGYAIDISHSSTKIFTKMSLAAGDDPGADAWRKRIRR